MEKLEFQRGPKRFYLNDDEGKLLAEITFEPTTDDVALIIEHTFVKPALRGQGIAAQLVQKVVDLANAEGKLIDPLCPYAHRLFLQNEEYQQIWYKHIQGE